MRYRIILAPEAIEDFEKFRANDQAIIRDALEKHLRHEPMMKSKSRIKKLVGLDLPQYRLRVGDVRIFYDVVEGVVEVLAIIPKSQAHGWLERWWRGK